MKLKIFIFVIVSLAFASEVRGGDDLRIYLPREKAIKGESIRLGDVGIVRGDESLVAMVEDVSLGKFSITGQQIVINKQTILSMLASGGIDTKDILFSGSDKVVVKRDEKVIPGGRIVEVAREFVDKQLSSYFVSSITLVGAPKDHVLPEGISDVELVVEPSRYSSKSKINVTVKIVEEGVEVDKCQVSFALRYNNRRAVASVNIPLGAVISSDNATVETFESSSPEKGEWAVPYGLVAKRNINAGSVIHDRLVGPLQAPIAVKRKQIVVVKVEAGGLSVSSLGEALSDGKVGEYIKVQMGTERGSRMIIAQITNDGTLKPVY